jgi:hypothetical protein
LKGAQRGNSAAGQRSGIVVDGTGKRRQYRDAGERNDIGIEREPRQSRDEPDRHQRREPDRRKRHVEEAMHQNRLRVAFQVGAEAGQQPIIRGGVIEIVHLAGEAETRRIEHAHIRECGPGFAGVLEMCDVGCVRHFIEAPCHILAHGAERGGDHEKQ